ncbi:MAG TPA: peptidoglycan recognition family protein, partial [Longimicrobium sp.]
MPKPFRQLTIEQFADELDRFKFTRKVTGVHMHHTWKPTQADYRGLSTIEGMWKFHTQNNGWSDIAQHVSIAPDGTIWTGRDWNVTPASATGFSSGAFMFETIGNFDVGHETLAGEQLRAVVEVIARVQIKHKLPLESLHFHREFTDQKTCPGNGLRKADVLALVRARRDEIEGGGTRDFPLDDEAAAQAFSRRRSFFGAAADGAAAAA